MNVKTPTFHKQVPRVGHFALRPLRIEADVQWIHDWVNREYAQYWGMRDTTPEDVAAAYRARTEHEGAQVFMGLHENKPAFLLECYEPRSDAAGQHYAVQPGDCGMHILVAPARRPISGFTWSVFTVILDFMFSDPAVTRIVVEPDIRNDKIHALNKRAGFQYQKIIQLPKKAAYLAFCTREQYHAALEKELIA